MNASPGGWHLTPTSREMVPLRVQRPRLSSPVSCLSPGPKWSPPICRKSVEVPPGCRTVQGLLRLEAPRRPIGASHLLRLRAREQQGAAASPVWDKSRHRAPVSRTSTLTTSGHTTCLKVRLPQCPSDTGLRSWSLLSLSPVPRPGAPPRTPTSQEKHLV